MQRGLPERRRHTAARGDYRFCVRLSLSLTHTSTIGSDNKSLLNSSAPFSAGWAAPNSIVVFFFVWLVRCQVRFNGTSDRSKCKNVNVEWNDVRRSSCRNATAAAAGRVLMMMTVWFDDDDVRFPEKSICMASLTAFQ